MREYNGATVDQAIQKAAGELGISQDNLKYEVLDTGSAGLLGIGARDARIQVAYENKPGDDNTSSYTRFEPREGIPADGTVTATNEQPAEEPAASPPELLEEVEEFMASALRAMDFEARVDVYDAGEYIAVDVATPQTGLFIGQKGETIDALQHLLNAATHGKHPNTKRKIIDSEGYRQRRIEALQGIAHRAARRAAREKKDIQLPTMSAAERRVVHTYLKENPQVTTRSEGTGNNRRVTVSPTPPH